MQMLNLGFRESLRSLWKQDGNSTIIKAIIGGPTLINYLEIGTFSSYLVIMYLCFALVIIFVIVISMAKDQEKEQNRISQSSLLIISRWWSYLMISIIFQPLFEVFMFIFMCSSDSNNNYYHIFYQNEQCFSITYTIHILFAILSIIIMLLYVSTLILL